MPCRLSFITRYMPISPTVPKQGSRKRPPGNETPLTISRPELKIDGSDHEFRSFVHGMLAFAARLEAVRSGFAGLVGLTGIQYTILISVKHLELQGQVNVSTIAEHLRVSGAFVTIETGKLLKLGLLTKRPDPEDRRRVCLSVTAKGRERLKRLAPAQVKVNDVLFEFMDAAEFRQLRGMVDRMTSCGDRAVALLDYLSKHGAASGSHR
jgi:DNA-binding MarR family transcriptional regulator